MDELLGLIIRLLHLIPIVAILLILTVVAWYGLRLIRVHLSKTELKPADYLESFQKLHEEGKLTTEEFRIIRQLVSLQFTRSPGEPNPNYSLLNKSTPSRPKNRPSENIPKN
jgi:hypothetical protein